MLKFKRVCLILLCMALMLSFVSCKGKDNESKEDKAYYSFTDSEGTTVELKNKPQKIAVLFSSYADIWKTAGGKVDITVGDSIERGFADDDVIIVDPSTGHNAIDLEKLVESKPDLVIGTLDFESQCKAVEFCRSVDIPSALFRVENFEDYLNVLNIFCDITGNKDNYRKYGTDVEKKIDSILNNLPKQSADKEILFIRAGSSANSTKAKTAKDNFVCAMLDQIGTKNIADSDNSLTGMLSLETIIDKNPYCMFITTMGDETAAKEYINSLLSSDGWRELDCVKNGRCYFLPKELFHYKPNARWAEAYDYLASIIYSGDKDVQK